MPYPDSSAQLTAALDAASRDWHVFPLISGDKRPAVSDWETRATTDPDRITRAWSVAAFNVGIATGPSGLVVIDLDKPKHPGDTPPAAWAEHGVTDGADVLAALCERHGQPFPADTYTVRTWSGGTHLYFATPEGEPLRNTAGDSARGLGWKVDTRAWGGLVVGAGSTFAGRLYEVTHDAPVAPLPGWLAELLRPAPLPPQTPITVALTGRGRRTAFLRSAVNGEVQRVTGSGPHEHNNSLYIASVALGQLVAGGELSEADVTGWLLTAALQVGQGEREARRTIASGLRAGARRPRTVAA
ncbi:bifunctional DNA primase/polymerase [Streptomyces sp. WAC05374]|uniref:bifunctional DNA primase/polymerase n=1 Tax=Streptomyces sp. WAC05374 TaxID=2487420 RepID=UPI000F863EEC|nr:bifunctional DNA primase/polymerase [Streptomyces sp. WAC05374]RST19128.1 DNA primase [Streptomyces sp. WAC05374]TDF38103.1 bifunctional DNA primase/polymerase [Streptomyces sp. WAC05374]TDF53562.1 bifunctional DNA primase/polymerase [Streptomyces sp. WAC05374]TDF59409.1 bifunctional DNA primase/polymerase [Streptomyces sp. WAC05374]